MKTDKTLVLWGFKPGTSETPIKLADYTGCSGAAMQRWRKDGWTVAAYRKGDEPTGLILLSREAK